MPLPSGMVTTPRRAQLVGRTARHVAAGDLDLAAPSGRIRPQATFSVVDLPAPFGPSSATHRCRRWTVEVDAVQHLDAVVRGADAAQLEQRLGSRRSPCRPSCRPVARRHRSPSRGARGRRSTHRSGRSLDRRSGGPWAMIVAEVEHVESVAHAHHERHVVLDQQDAEPGVGPARRSSSPNASVSRSSRPDAGSSSSRTRRPGRQRPGQLDQPGLAGGQLPARTVGDRGRGRAGRGAGRPRPTAEVAVGRRAAGARRCATPSRDGSRAATSTLSRTRQRREHLEALERPADAAAGPLWVSSSVMSLAVEHDPTAVGVSTPHISVEQSWSCRRRWGRSGR